MAAEPTLVFYDIASNKPLRTFAPNPWKTRFALNFKGVPYRTEWVHMPNIQAVREKLGVQATRTLPDGSPFHTLPVLHDTTNGTILGDTFEIALYLDSAYPEGPSLLRPHTTGLTAALNAYIDDQFTMSSILCDQMPFDPSVEEEVHAMFCKRIGVSSWDDLKVSSEQREPMFVALEATLGKLIKAYRHTGGTTDHILSSKGTAKEHGQRPPPNREELSPFLDGDGPAYEDFIVGAWLKMLEASMNSEDWQRVRDMQSGFAGRVVDALSKWSEIK